MDKCKCYSERIETIYLDYKNIRTAQRIIGHCSGTKECEVCGCKGNKLNCDFYDYIREEAKKEQLDYKIKEAINLLVDNGYLKNSTDIPIVCCDECTFWDSNHISNEGFAKCNTGESGIRYRKANDFCSRGNKKHENS